MGGPWVTRWGHWVQKAPEPPYYYYCYNLTADAYLKSIRGIKRSGASTYKMFLTSLREMIKRYMDARKIVTLSDLVEANVQEQFLMSLKDNVLSLIHIWRCRRRG